MAFPKQIRDIVYKLLQEPTLDNFREFLQNQTGEHNAIDFKREWICKDKLAKLMLALANYGGGVVVFGVQENENKTFSCEGLKALNGKEHVKDEVKAYISTNLKYEIYDFTYQSSEYKSLEGKNFQMLVVEDTPEFLPFISHKESTDIKDAAIYIRRGTSDEMVNEQELEDIFPFIGECQAAVKRLYLVALETIWDDVIKANENLHDLCSKYAISAPIIICVDESEQPHFEQLPLEHIKYYLEDLNQYPEYNITLIEPEHA